MGPYFLIVLKAIITHSPKKSRSFHNYVIVLVKGKGDTKMPANFQNIALINVVAKIFTKAYTKCLHRINFFLVTSYQSLFNSGRCITERLFYIQDLLHWIQRHSFQITVLCLNFNKAKDQINIIPTAILPHNELSS